MSADLKTFEDQVGALLPTDNDRAILAEVLDLLGRGRRPCLGEVWAYLNGSRGRPKLSPEQCADALGSFLADSKTPSFGSLKAFLRKAAEARRTRGSGVSALAFGPTFND